MATLKQTTQATTTEYDEWEKYVDDIDQETVEVSGPQFPYIQWVNGKPDQVRAGGVQYTGGWFIQGEQIGEDELPGWQKDKLYHRDNSFTEGFFCRDITVAMVHSRRRWLVGENGDTIAFPWDHYDEAKEHGRPTGQQHVLSFVRGLEHYGPLVLTMKGSTSAAFTGGKRQEGVVGRFVRLVIRAANIVNQKRGSKAKWPHRAFWLTVGPERNDKGEPHFTEVGEKPNSSFVTLPAALGLHEQMTPQEIGKLFVGKDMLDTLNAWYRDSEDWWHAWDETQAVRRAEEPKEAAPAPAAIAEPESEHLPF